MTTAKQPGPKIKIHNGVRYRMSDVKGDGPTCIFIHGLGNSLNFWNEVLPELAQDMSVLALDLPSSGHSIPPPGGTSLPHIADTTYAFLVDMGIRQATIVAHSFGVATALTLAQRYPDFVQRIVMVNSTLHTADLIIKHPGTSILHPRVALTLATQLFGASLRPNELIYSLAQSTTVTRRLALASFVDDPAHIDPHVVQMALSENAGIPVMQTLREIRALDFTALMSSIKIPTALIWGASDPLITRFDVAETTSLMSVYATYPLPDCRHWPMLEMPDEFLDAVRSCLV